MSFDRMRNMLTRAAEIRESEQQQIFDALDEIHARMSPLESLGSVRKRLSELPDRTEVSMTQLRQASFGGHTYLCPEAGLLARTDDDPARRYGRSPAIDKMLTTTGDPARTLLVLSGDVSDLQGGRLTLDYRLTSAISQTSGIPEQDHCPESFSVELSGPYVLIPLWLSGVPEGLYGTLYDADGQVVDTF